MQLELPKRLNSILPILKWNLTFYFRERIQTKLKGLTPCQARSQALQL